MQTKNKYGKKYVHSAALRKRQQGEKRYCPHCPSYFPYMEKLIPVINFLRECLGFNDEIIRRLCEFTEIGIKGKLYSSEFNQSFDTRHSVCSIKQDENGKFDFKIDGAHVSWFRKKMNEFREAIGIPKSRQTQNRGIKL